MAEKLLVQLEDSDGNIYYLHTSADVVFCEDGTSVQTKLAQKIEKADIIQNATTASTTKVVSASVAKNLQDQINEQNTKKANVQSGHACEVGLSDKNARIFPYVNFDGAQIDLIPNNIDQIGNVKILNAKVIYNVSPWQLQLEIYIDGSIYYKKVNLSD